LNLRDLAAADHRLLVEDAVGGFGRELVFVDPLEHQGTVNGLWNDIGQAIDPQTGALVAGTVAFVHVALGALRAVGLGVPYAVNDTDKLPWTVMYKDLTGKEVTCKIVEVRKDRSFDAVLCYLASYKQS
jgi:hypothetical protein